MGGERAGGLCLKRGGSWRAVRVRLGKRWEQSDAVRRCGMACCGSRPGAGKREGSSGDSAPLLKRKKNGAAPPATPPPPLVSLGTIRPLQALASLRRN